MAAEQPNVVLMLADNVGYDDIGAFAGGEVRGIPTPNIDQQASELVKINRGEPSLTAKYPWLVAFTFGLLHGFGFAGALSQVGLPQNEIPLALLMFNVGVELGQLMFIVVMLVLIRALHRIRHSWPQWVYQLPAYGIGSMAAFWFVERVSGFLN